MQATEDTTPSRTAEWFKLPQMEDSLLDIRKFLLIILQFVLLVISLHLFNIEEASGFLRVTPVIILGFIVHSLLPINYRLSFFFFLSIGIIVYVYGLGNSVFLLGIGLSLIGICHLPISRSIRVILLISVGILLIALRAEWITTRWNTLSFLVLPVIGSMFMFRLVIYMYDLAHERKAATIWERLNYFFMFPNLFFLLFPVIDYQTYRRTYYDKPAHDIYQKGVLWMFRGLTQLIFYRFIYYYALPTTSEIIDLATVFQYMIATYLLYLRISGQFHFIIGLLCMFGFNLPETHNLYFFASSLSDYWRRINIYWKDFMMKIFYYPAFMRLRKVGPTFGVVVSTLIVFLVTWLLHSYQWFWLQGTFPLTATDALFWGVLGFFVVFNALLEMKKGRSRSLDTPSWSFMASVIHSAKVLGIFLLFTLLWTMWSSETLAEFIELIRIAASDTPLAYAVFALVFVFLVLTGVLLQYLESKKISLSLSGKVPSFNRSFSYTLAGLLLLIILGLPQVQSGLNPGSRNLLASLKDTGLNDSDSEDLIRGYYEGLLNQGRRTFALQRVQNQPSSWVAPEPAGAYNRRNDLIEYELVPNFSGWVKESQFTINQWGMHDQEYALSPPEDIIRIAFLGASYEEGAGVLYSQTYEAVAEKLYNEMALENGDKQVEMLNFALGGYSITNNVGITREKVMDFNPDVILYALHSNEKGRIRLRMNQILNNDAEINDEVLEEIIQRSGATKEMEREEINRRFEPLMPEILHWGLSSIKEKADANGIRTIVVLVPSTDEVKAMDYEQSQVIEEIAKEVGWEVYTMDGAFGDAAPEVIRLAGWDWHPNVLGHKLLGEELSKTMGKMNINSNP